MTDEQIEQNAKYCISISRKLGATVFLVWEDIRDMKIKMLTTFIAAIMDVYNLEFALKGQKDKIVEAEVEAEEKAEVVAEVVPEVVAEVVPEVVAEVVAEEVVVEAEAEPTA